MDKIIKAWDEFINKARESSTNAANELIEILKNIRDNLVEVAKDFLQQIKDWHDKYISVRYESAYNEGMKDGHSAATKQAEEMYFNEYKAGYELGYIEGYDVGYQDGQSAPDKE